MRKRSVRPLSTHSSWYALESRLVPAVTFTEATSTTILGITPTRDAFRTLLGGPVTPTDPTTGNFGNVRREIDWDSVPNTEASPNLLPGDYFNTTSARGVVLSTPGTGFLVSADTPNENFKDIEASYASQFSPFSTSRLFTAKGSNIIDVTFFVPGTKTQATVLGFGAMFVDVDVAGSTKMEAFDTAGNLIASRDVLHTFGTQTYSFLGISVAPGDAPIAKVRITSGYGTLGSGNFDITTNPAGTDLVVLDDFIYSEPVAIPNPTFSGKVFNDFDGNGKQDTNEPVLPNITVFLDGNGNGKLDPGEVSAVTDSKGQYTLTAPTQSGTFTVVYEPPVNITVTTPLPTPVTAMPGQDYTNIDFGLRLTPQPFAVGPGSSTASTAKIFNSDGTVKATLTPFTPTFTGGVRVAMGDVNGDGILDVAVGTGPGASTQVTIFDGANSKILFSIAPFEASFKGGVFVALGDLNGDGLADLAISPDEGGGPRVRLFDAANKFSQINDFFGIEDPNFFGGVRIAIADLDGDQIGDLLVAAGFGGGPRLAGFAGATISKNGPNGLPPKLFNDFFVFEQTLRNGVFIAAGDIDGDGFADVVAGGGPGGGPRVFVVDGKDLVTSSGKTITPVANFFADDPNLRGGVRVAVKNLDGDANWDIITGSGDDEPARVLTFSGDSLPLSGLGTPVLSLSPFSGAMNGVFVG